MTHGVGMTKVFSSAALGDGPAMRPKLRARYARVGRFKSFIGREVDADVVWH